MFVVRIHCGGNRKSFLLGDKAKAFEGPMGTEAPTATFETEDAAEEAGNNSVCVNVVGWPFEVEVAP